MMKTSFTFKVTLLVLRLIGIKKMYSQTPINVAQLRKGDVFKPKGCFWRKDKVTTFTILKSNITAINSSNENQKLTIFIHGGAFVSGPAQHHWESIKTINKALNNTIWLCNYPKAPETTIDEINMNIDAIYLHALKSYSTQNIQVIGDSAGGTLALTLVQRLIQNSQPVPSKIVAICPVADASFSHPEIDAIDKIDPMLGKEGVRSAKVLCGQDLDLKSPTVSPLYGEVKGFPPTVLFLATNDICYPDGQLFEKKLKENLVETTTYIGNGMPHIWPLLPIMREGKEALKQVIKELE